MSKKSPKRKPSLTKPRSRLWIFAAIFAVIGAILLIQTYAAPKNRSGVKLYLAPTSQSLRVGDMLSLAVRVDTFGQSVNAVQANLTYPSNNFDFVSINSTDSSFEVDAQTSGGGGVVEIARGSTTKVNSSNALLATVNLRAKAAGRKLQIRLADNSSVVDATTNLNILQIRSGGQYTVQ